MCYAAEAYAAALGPPPPNNGSVTDKISFLFILSCVTPALLWYRPDNHQKEHEEVCLINLASVAELKRPDTDSALG